MLLVQVSKFWDYEITYQGRHGGQTLTQGQELEGGRVVVSNSCGSVGSVANVVVVVVGAKVVSSGQIGHGTQGVQLL